MLSRVGREDDRESDGGESAVTEEVAGKKKVVLDVENVPLHYPREVENMMATILSCKADNVSVGDQAVHFRRKLS